MGGSGSHWGSFIKKGRIKSNIKEAISNRYTGEGAMLVLKLLEVKSFSSSTFQRPINHRQVNRIPAIKSNVRVYKTWRKGPLL